MVGKIAGMQVTIPEEARHKIVGAIDLILTKGWLMWGEWQENLVAKFTEATGKRYGVTFNSATSAFDVLFDYLGRQDEGPAGFQATGFPSPIFSAMRQGYNVHWLDIDRQMMVPTLDQLTDEMKVYVPQWTGGFIPIDVDGQRAWCDEYGVTMVEDCSHASGSYQHDQHAGSFGHHAVFSLAATKPLQTGQGGMLLTDDGDLAEFAFQMKNYGRDQMFQRGEYLQPGHNLHMTEIQAAIGVILWDYMDEQIKRRAEIAERIIVEADLVPLGDWTGMPNFYKLAVLIPERYATRSEWAEQMARFDVEMGSSVYDFFTPHLKPLLDRGVGVPEQVECPDARVHVGTHACIPCHNGMTDEDIERVVEACVG